MRFLRVQSSAGMRKKGLYDMYPNYRNLLSAHLLFVYFMLNPGKKFDISCRAEDVKNARPSKYWILATVYSQNGEHII